MKARLLLSADGVDQHSIAARAERPSSRVPDPALHHRALQGRHAEGEGSADGGLRPVCPIQLCSTVRGKGARLKAKACLFAQNAWLGFTPGQK